MSMWINGQSADAISAADRGLAFGDGLFETMRVAQGNIPFLARHLARLERGAQRLQLPLDLALIETEIKQFIKHCDAGVCKLIYTRGSGQRGYALPVITNSLRVLQLSALPDYPQAHAEHGVHLYPCQTRLASQPMLAGIKHLNRLEQVLARAEWSTAEFAEGLMLDQQGNVLEGVFSNVFCVLDGVLTTPDLSTAGVLGTMRAFLLERAEQLAIPVQVSDISLAQFATASEVFTCNSLYGIWPVREYNGQQWPVGPISKQLQQHVAALFSGIECD